MIHPLSGGEGRGEGERLDPSGHNKRCESAVAAALCRRTPRRFAPFESHWTTRLVLDCGGAPLLFIRPGARLCEPQPVRVSARLQDFEMRPQTGPPMQLP